MSNVYTKKI